MSEDPQFAWHAIDRLAASPARTYDYWLGGKDNFKIDRDRGDAIREAFPGITTSVRTNRAFLDRAVWLLTRDLGVRQFLDIGTGLPTVDPTHVVAQRLAPESRIVYVDNDPMVLSHARALLDNCTPTGVLAYIDADLRKPDVLLHNPDLTQHLNFNEPIALLLVAVLHFISDKLDPYGIVATLVDALPAGSYLVLSHATREYLSDAQVAQVEEADRAAGIEFAFRDRAQVIRFFEGLELLEPGVVPTSEWRPELPSVYGHDYVTPNVSPADAAIYAGVARVTRS